MKLNEAHLQYLALQSKLFSFKSGNLFKKSGRKKTPADNVSVRWQKRWCAVYCNMLFYFESDTSPKPQGVVFLEDVCVNPVNISEKGYYCFTLGISGSDHRQFLFGCEEEVESDEWISAIKESRYKHVIQHNKNQEAMVQETLAKLHCVEDEKERYKKEISDYWAEINRLKMELCTLRKNSKSSMGERLVQEPFYHETELLKHQYSLNDIKKIEKLQSFVRSWLVHKRWKILVKSFVDTFTITNFQERNKLLWQLITSEEGYAQQMNTLVNVFLKPMKNLSYSSSQTLSNEEHAKIFSKSHSILVMHQIMMARIDCITKHWPAIQIDEILADIMSSIPIYVDYIKNHPLSLRTLAECKKRTDFLKMLHWFETKPECNNQTLEQLLNYPVTVIPNYIRSVHSLLNVTPQNHSERNSLEQLLLKLQEAQVYNHFLDEGENIRQTLEIERLIVGGCHVLLNANQKFIRHGVLKQIGTEENGLKKEKLRHCFLFSHHLIIASRTHDGHLRLSNVIGTIPISCTSLVEDIENTSYPDTVKYSSFTLQVNGESESFSITLMANKSSDKALWTSDITQCIYNLALEESINSVTLPTNKETLDQYETLEENVQKRMLGLLTIKEDIKLRVDSEDIKYGDELTGPYHLPQILYASVDRLIERLYDPRLPGGEFMETFLLTYRAFTKAHYVINKLIDAYWMVVGGKASPKESIRKISEESTITTTRTRGISILSSSSYSSFDDDAAFHANASTSTTVFNYTTVKEQLNLPLRKSADTSQWCQDQSPQDGDLASHGRRCSSLCVSPVETMLKDTEKIYRRHSMEFNSASDESNEKDFIYSYNSQKKNGFCKQEDFSCSENSSYQSNSHENFFMHFGIDQNDDTENTINDFQLSENNNNILSTKKVEQPLNNNDKLLTKKVEQPLKSIECYHNKKNVENNFVKNKEINFVSEIPIYSSSLNSENEFSNKSNFPSVVCDEVQYDVCDSQQSLTTNKCVTDFKNNRNLLVSEKDQLISGCLNCMQKKSESNLDTIKVTHSKSDETISASQNKNELPKSSRSLDQQKVSTSPSFWPKKKAKSLTQENSIPFDTKSDKNKSSLSKQLDSRDCHSISDLNADEITQKFEETDPDLSKQRDSTDSSFKPKRSLFNMAFSFRKSGLKRSTSEQVLNVSKTIKAKTSFDNNSLLSGSMAKISEDSKITEDLQFESPLRNDKTFDGIKKRMKASIRLTSKKDQSPNRNRKVSLFDQSIINVNRNLLKIMSIFKHWLAKHPKDFIEDYDLCGQLLGFFEDIKSDYRTLPVILEIVSNLEKCINAQRRSLSSVHHLDILLLQNAGSMSKDDSLKSLDAFNYDLVAENITLLEHYLYSKISFSEFISCQWTKKDKEKKAPGIMKFIARFNQITNMISYTVVHGESPQIRANKMEFWIRVASHCRDLNNFNGIMEIISALNASSIHRLKKSWELLPKPVKDIFIELEKLVSADRSFKQLREAVHLCNPPCVPYLGCYLSDLLFAQEGGPTFDDNNLVNFAKMSRVSRLVREVKCYQQLPYTFQINDEVMCSLINFGISVDQDELYNHSLLVEPRGVT
ncbi:ras-specific guanine nucleotide-releasing factor 1 isoform X1 [Hydra vulgaris]|uniref:ras-specific guanine nucleotide-releasing factor 1 isoform X1 n=1 Tax=Hydra vulgaris TaxID=6087 RepID=UPI001F5E57C3|nr:ras-specific guanine nucleotide-releasing factor 1-like isoform X2 [Hydra vulgaris]